MPDIRCSDTEPHMFHHHDIIVERECSGTTPCGEFLHEPHQFDKQIQVWCPGICECGLRGYLHGPGAHK